MQWRHDDNDIFSTMKELQRILHYAREQVQRGISARVLRNRLRSEDYPV
jgi:hypothetical protein